MYSLLSRTISPTNNQYSTSDHVKEYIVTPVHCDSVYAMDRWRHTLKNGTNVEVEMTTFYRTCEFSVRLDTSQYNAMRTCEKIVLNEYDFTFHSTSEERGWLVNIARIHTYNKTQIDEINMLIYGSLQGREVDSKNEPVCYNCNTALPLDSPAHKNSMVLHGRDRVVCHECSKDYSIDIESGEYVSNLRSWHDDVFTNSESETTQLSVRDFTSRGWKLLDTVYGFDCPCELKNVYE